MKFRIFKDGEPVTKFASGGAYLTGTDGIVIRKPRITFKDGIITCEKQNEEASSLSLLWSVEGFGRVLLPTTCLPEREAPYNLNVEIARAKLMQIVNKCEDWSFFSEMDELKPLAKESQDLFVKALQNLADGKMASKFADESLKKAMVFSELMALKHAEVHFNSRLESSGFGRACLGCKIDPQQISNAKYLTKLTDVFGFATIPVNWGAIEKKKDEYDFSVMDKCINILSKKKLTIGAGPLLYFVQEFLPEWLIKTKPSFEQVRESAYKFVYKCTERYANNVRTWFVVRGLNAFNHFGFNFEQVVEMTRAGSMAVKAASERAVKIIEVANPWGEYYAALPDTIPPLVYVDMVVQSGINFDGFGLQMCFGKNQSGMHVRDMLQISAILDHFFMLNRPLYITEVEVPSKSGSGSYDGTVAGVWHDKWSAANQQQWIEQFYKIAFSKSFIDAVIYSSLADSHNNIVPNSGLLTAELEPKGAYEAIKKLRDTIFVVK